MTDEQLEWTDLDRRAVDTVRVLAADAVENVGNGHPGTAMSLAPAAYLLFQRHLRHDPSDPQWLGRDRFVLSCGHSSLTLYLQLFLSGYGLQLSDLQSFRTWGSATPGHPEFGHTAGVETTTGPLGQGLANAVGMAMAARYERGLFDPDAPVGASPFDRTIWVLASDGDIQEGVSAEASSLAGTQELDNLVVIWDDNRISIEGDTTVAFTEDVVARYQAYGWHTEVVNLAPNGDLDVAALHAAIQRCKAQRDRPSFIALRSIIGWPAPTKQNTGDIHGAKLGAEEVASVKRILGFDPAEQFAVQPEVLAHARAVGERAREPRAAWDARYQAWRDREPARAALLDRILRGELPAELEASMPTFEADEAMATRAASGHALEAMVHAIPEVWGGSADLAGSNNTTFKISSSFLPASSEAPKAHPYGRVVHFGIREHAMAAILNGIALSGLTRPLGGTFLVFSDYMRGAMRLSALMNLPVTYVLTHDSIGLGEDGPTHQPVEHLWSLRAIPGFAVVRPADARETVGAWLSILQRRGPAGLVLTRQSVPGLDHQDRDVAADVRRGAYVLADAADGSPDVLLLASGSEVSLAVEAREQLRTEGIAARVVSMPCLEWFAEQPAEYVEAVLPRRVRARVSVEAGSTIGWHRYLGDHGEAVGLDHFGASAAGPRLFEEFGITADAVAAAARRSIAAASEQPSVPLSS